MNRERTFILLTVALLWIGSGSAMALGYRSGDQPGSSDRQWDKHLLTINFIDKNPESEGSKIYHAIIPDPDTYIRSVAREVLRTLYFSPHDSIPECKVLDYVLRRDKGISAKDGGPTGWPSRSARVTRPGWTLRPAAYCCMS